jgi:hypothetical protein
LYPYHTLINFDADGVHISRIEGPQSVDVMSTKRRVQQQPQWQNIELSMSQARLVVKVNGERVMTLPYENDGMSLVGLQVERGSTRFEHPILGPEGRFATGPRSLAPPRLRRGLK